MPYKNSIEYNKYMSKKIYMHIFEDLVSLSGAMTMNMYSKNIVKKL